MALRELTLQLMTSTEENKSSRDSYISISKGLSSTDNVQKDFTSASFHFNNLQSSNANTSYSIPAGNSNKDTPTITFDHYDAVWDKEILRQVDESAATAISSQQTPPESMIPMKPLVYRHVFVSTPVEKKSSTNTLSTISHHHFPQEGIHLLFTIALIYY